MPARRDCRVFLLDVSHFCAFLGGFCVLATLAAMVFLIHCISSANTGGGMQPWQDDVSYVCVHPPLETTTAERRNFLGMFCGVRCAQ